MRTSTRRRAVSFFAIVFIAAGGMALNAFASQPPALVELDGRLVVAHGDDFTGHNMVMAASVRTSHGTVRLHVRASQHAQLMALAGRQVRVRGTREASGFNATNLSSQGVAASVPSTGNKRIAVILMHLPGSTTEPWTKAQAQSAFFGTNSVASWFSEVSTGATTVTGDVYGYYNTTQTSTDCVTLFSDWQNQATAAAAKDGYIASNYQHVVYATPDLASCGFSGIAWIGQSGVWLNGNINPGVADHELGHNLGLRHAGTLDCGTQVIGGSCTRSDYGDPFDVMGNAGANHHYSASHKAAIGYLASSAVKTVTAGSQTITLTSSEQSVAGATQLINVQAPNGTKYGIEKRSSFGTYDQGLGGVWIRQLGVANTDDTTLLDMTPSTNAFTDGNLSAGNTFTDSASGISIRTESEGTSTASVTVTVGGTPTSTTAPVATTTTTKATTTTTAPPPTTTTTRATTTTTAAPPPPQPPLGTVSVTVSGTTVVVTGSTGNDTLHLWKVRNNRLAIDANGAPIAAGAGCSVSNGVAQCGGKSFAVAAGAGADRITVSGAVHSTQDGGDGNDWMIGGTSSDVFTGGAGFDAVDYSTRTGTITGTPGTGADDGTRREADNIMGDVEQVILPSAKAH
jgi:hypothetical protein